MHSNELVGWRCTEGHIWETVIAKRTFHGHGCPKCYAMRRGYKADGTRSRHPHLSDSNHQMMADWDTERNAEAGFDPSKIRLRSQKPVHWICCRCPKGTLHRWQSAANERFTRLGCPNCSGHKICECNSLQTHWPQLASEWDYDRNDKAPSDYTAQSNWKVGGGVLTCTAAGMPAFLVDYRIW